MYSTPQTSTIDGVTTAQQPEPATAQHRPRPPAPAPLRRHHRRQRRRSHDRLVGEPGTRRYPHDRRVRRPRRRVGSRPDRHRPSWGRSRLPRHRGLVPLTGRPALGATSQVPASATCVRDRRVVRRVCPPLPGTLSRVTGLEGKMAAQVATHTTCRAAWRPILVGEKHLGDVSPGWPMPDGEKARRRRAVQGVAGQAPAGVGYGPCRPQRTGDREDRDDPHTACRRARPPRR